MEIYFYSYIACWIVLLFTDIRYCRAKNIPIVEICKEEGYRKLLQQRIYVLLIPFIRVMFVNDFVKNVDELIKRGQINEK